MGVNVVDQAGRTRVTVHELEEITRSANIPTLLMVIYQVTGDPRWLQPPYRPTRSKGLSDHDTGGLREDVQREIRLAAAQSFYALQQGKPPAIPVPSPEQTAAMLGACVGEEVDESYGVMFSQEFRRRVRAVERAVPRRAGVPLGFCALVIGATPSPLPRTTGRSTSSSGPSSRTTSPAPMTSSGPVRTPGSAPRSCVPSTTSGVHAGRLSCAVRTERGNRSHST